MTASLLDLLREVDTPTVCNAIEVAQGQRGFNAFTRGTMLASDPGGGPMVGYARTAKIAALAPPEEPADVIKARRMDYYRHMASGSRPALAVIEDVDYPDCIGAYWGEINTTVHKGFGLSGALTNGVMRDLGDLPDGLPRIATAIIFSTDARNSSLQESHSKAVSRIFGSAVTGAAGRRPCSTRSRRGCR